MRDGFRYIGFVHAISPMKGELIHGHPIIGGYMARVPQKIFDYYQKLKFIGYLSKIIDKGNYNLNTQKPNDVRVYPYPYSIFTINKELDDLDIRFILLKNDEKYSETIASLISKAGFENTMSDNNYDLYIKE